MVVGDYRIMVNALRGVKSLCLANISANKKSANKVLILSLLSCLFLNITANIKCYIS